MSQNPLDIAGPPMSGLSIAQILDEADARMPARRNGHSNGIMVPEGFIPEDEAKRREDMARAETVEADSSFFLQQLMTGITSLAGDRRAAGQAIDDAITHWLVDIHQHYGRDYCQMIAALMVGNIALFLPEAVRDQVRGLVEPVANGPATEGNRA